MFFSYLTRQFHTSSSLRVVEKSLLAALRKKTGYTFTNCKKALELSNNNLPEAEKWLEKQAQSLGWAKATKLEGRETSQGLVGLMVKNNCAALLELNCETDFVARNEHFRNMTKTAIQACLNFISNYPDVEIMTKVDLDGDRLKSLSANDGKSLADHLALLIGTVGENASLKRALCMKTRSNILLTGHTHPSSEEKVDDVQFGKYGALLAYRRDPSKITENDVIGRQLCQHIIGMNPKRIGVLNADTPSEDVDNEPCLIYQEFVSDPSLFIHQVLSEHGIEIVDFGRFECGETILNSLGKQVNLEDLQVCQ